MAFLHLMILRTLLFVIWYYDDSNYSPINYFIAVTTGFL